MPAFPPGHWIRVVCALLNKTPSTLLKSLLVTATSIAVRLLQLLNTKSPMEVTLSGIVTLVRLLSL